MSVWQLCQFLKASFCCSSRQKAGLCNWSPSGVWSIWCKFTHELPADCAHPQPNSIQVVQNPITLNETVYSHLTVIQGTLNNTSNNRKTNAELADRTKQPLSHNYFVQSLTVPDETYHMGDTGWYDCACGFTVFPWKFAVNIGYPFQSDKQVTKSLRTVHRAVI